MPKEIKILLTLGTMILTLIGLMALVELQVIHDKLVLAKEELAECYRESSMGSQIGLQKNRVVTSDAELLKMFEEISNKVDKIDKIGKEEE